MIRKTSAKREGFVQVQFELPGCLWADRVAVVGNFNDWRSDATPMRQLRDGSWRALIELPINRRFQFHYLIDGQPLVDGQADGFVDAPSGKQHSVIDTTINYLPPMPESVMPRTNQFWPRT